VTGPVTVRVLGPFAATVGGRAVDLGGPRQRAVLGRLVVAGGHVVPTDRLIDDLWGDTDVPAKALAACWPWRCTGPGGRATR
jgi:DNA-binding SARP family transcriptional activator